MAAVEQPDIRRVADGILGDGSMLVVIAEKDDEGHLVAALAVQVWGEALRDPQFGAELAASFERAKTALTKVIRRNQREGRLTDRARPEALTTAFFCVLPGYLGQRALMGPDAVKATPAAMRALFPG